MRSLWWSEESVKPEMLGFLTSAGRGNIVFFGKIHPQTLWVSGRQPVSLVSDSGGREPPGKLFWRSSGARASLVVILQATGLWLPRKVLVAVV